MTDESNLLFGDWDVESLRASIFHPGTRATAPRSELWLKLIGKQPESIESRPAKGITRVVGNVGESNLTLAIQEDRTDWVFQPIPPQPPVPSKVLTLGNAEEKLNLLRSAVSRTIEVTTAVDRLAFNPVLMKQVSDEAEGLEQLSVYLPSLPMGSNASDFSYQVNRGRRSSSVPHVRVNRLARWFIGYVGGIDLKVGLSKEHLVGTWQFPIRKLNLDINSDPASGAVAGVKISSLFDEFISLASELARKGDIP